MPTTGAPVAAHDDFTHRGAPAERLVRQPSDDRVARHAFTAAAPAPFVGLDDSTREHGAVGLDSLSGDLEPELVHARESSQIGSIEALD